MARVAAAGALLGASVMLHGCGQDDEGNPGNRSVPQVWSNHWGAFNSRDLDQIMLDYDEDSFVWLFNNGGGCSESSEPGEAPPAQTAGLEEFKGKDAIRGMFEGLFQTFGGGATLNTLGPWENEAVVLGGVQDDQYANVFATWRTDGAIAHAAETATFKNTLRNSMIAQHNIVINQAGKACSTGRDKSPVFCGTVSGAVKAGICRSWWGENVAGPGAGSDKGQGNNLAHLDIENIMLDYSANSVVQLFDTRTKIYIYFDNIAAVRQMHIDMIKTITDNDAISGKVLPFGIKQILLEVNEATNTVLFVFSCTVYPKATMTFRFENTGDKPKILRMNMHVTTAGGRSAKVSKIHV